MEYQNVTLFPSQGCAGKRRKSWQLSKSSSLSGLMTRLLEELVSKRDAYDQARGSITWQCLKSLIWELVVTLAGAGRYLHEQAIKILHFLDTNVLLYAHDKSAGEKQQQAGAIVTAMWESGNGCLSVQVLQEFYVNITQKVAQRLDKEVALQIIKDLACWRIHVPDAAEVLKAIEIQIAYKISFWDAMVIRSAQAMRCQTLWTEDLQAGQVIAGVRAVNPFTSQSD